MNNARLKSGASCEGKPARVESKFLEGIPQSVSDLEFLPYLTLSRILYGPFLLDSWMTLSLWDPNGK